MAPSRHRGDDSACTIPVRNGDTLAEICSRLCSYDPQGRTAACLNRSPMPASPLPAICRKIGSAKTSRIASYSVRATTSALSTVIARKGKAEALQTRNSPGRSELPLHAGAKSAWPAIKSRASGIGPGPMPGWSKSGKPRFAAGNSSAKLAVGLAGLASLYRAVVMPRAFVLRVSGSGCARKILAKCVPVDLHPERFWARRRCCT